MTKFEAMKDNTDSPVARESFARRGTRRRVVIAAIACSVALIVVAALCAPWLCAEYFLPQHGPLVAARTTAPVLGRWFDDYFLIETIDPQTFAIGEPRYYQGNYSYLIVGSGRAVLFDAGTGNRDIVAVVRSLTRLPVTVVASHLHFDHVGALGRFERTAMLDDERLRQRAPDGWITLRRYEFLGFADHLPEPRFRIDDWWAPGRTVDLGDRHLTVLHTPGHTPTSVSLYDADRRLLFCGDFLYPGTLYAFLPGASRRQYLDTTGRLLTLIDPSTELLAAHLDDSAKTLRAPRMRVTDLKALRVVLQTIDAGTAVGSGFYPRTFPVNASIRFATGFPWNNR
jgi:hydroxyacylglutathione hydrolase